MTLPREALDAVIDASAQMLKLKIAPEWKASVRANLEVSLFHAGRVAEFPLPDEADPAPVFTP